MVDTPWMGEPRTKRDFVIICDVGVVPKGSQNPIGVSNIYINDIHMGTLTS